MNHKMSIAVTGISEVTFQAELTRLQNIGDGLMALANVIPAEATNPGITWSASNPSVININPDTGFMTAAGYGSTEIIATTIEGNFTKQATFRVGVVAEGISDISGSSSVNVGQTITLSASATPNNAENKSVKWSSLHPTIASVDEDTGVVTGLIGGTATIRATTVDMNFPADYPITIIVPVSGISDITITNGVTSTLVTSIPDAYTSWQAFASINPPDATNPPSIVWSTSNSDIINITNAYTGTFLAQGYGSATITATTSDGSFSKPLTIYVGVPVEGLSDIRDASGTIVTGSIQVLINGTTNVNAFVVPANAINSNRTWTSSDPDIAEINPINGYITGKALGTVTMTITTEGGQFSKSVTCHVVDDIPVTELTTSSLISDPDRSITIDGTTYINMNGLNYQSFNNYNNVYLNVYANPFNAVNRSLTYSCANTEVLTINSTGLMAVKPNFSLAAGAITNTTVTVTSVSNPNISATYNVRVTNPDISSAFIHSSRTFLLGVGESTTLLELWSVADNAPLVTNGPVYFESSNPSVVSIQLIYDQPHVFTGVAEGSATITAYYENKVAKCTLYVRDQSTFVEVVSVSSKFLEPTSDSTVITSNPNESSFWTSELQTINPITMYTVSPSTASFIVEATLSRSDIISINSSGVLAVVPKAPGVAYNTSDYTDVTVKFMTWNSNLTYTHKIRLDIVTTGYQIRGIFGIEFESDIILNPDAPTLMTMFQTQDELLNVWQDYGQGSVMSNLGYIFDDTIWSISDSETIVGTVEGRGDIHFRTAGTQWIRCMVGGRHYADIQINILDPNQITGVSSIEIFEIIPVQDSNPYYTILTDNTISLGIVIQVNAYTLPTGTNETVTYASSDSTIISFRTSKDGGLSNEADVLAAGPVTITATSGSFSSTRTLTVENTIVAVTGIDSLKTAADESVSFNLYPNSPVTLTATVHPGNATNKTINWSTDNDQVATVVDGVVTYVGDGTCLITATTVDGPFSASITCVASVPVASIADISTTSTSIAPGASLQLSSSISPPEATNKVIDWALSSPVTGVSISSEGLLSVASDVTSVTSITVTATANGDNTKTTSQTISVYYAVADITSLVGAGSATTIIPAGSLQLSATISPSYATNKGINWSVDSAAAAAGITVSSEGLLSVPSNVTTVTSITVTATSADNGAKSTTASFSVIYAASTLSDITASKYTISPGESLTMSSTVGPSYATNKKVNWSLNVASSVAAINDAGVLSLGSDPADTTTIIVTATADGNSSLVKTKPISIIVPVTSVNAITTAAPNGLVIAPSSTIQLACTVNPPSATNKKINWSINVTNPTIASISSSGLVTIGALIPPSLTSITVTATSDDDSSKSSTESLVFPSAVQSLTLIGAAASSVRPGGTLQLTCTTNPPTATNNVVNWSLDVASSVATISSSGLLSVSADVTNVASINVIATSAADSTKVQRRTISMYYPVSSVETITTGTGVNRIIPGTSLALLTSISPSHATDKGVTWSIDVGPSVATISTAGMLAITSTSLPLTQTSITVTATAIGDNTKSNSLTIPVYYPVTGISLAASGGTTVSVGSSTTVVATITPSYATNKTLSWATGNVNKVTVTESSGTVTVAGVEAITSQVNITATSVDGPTRTLPFNVGEIAVSGMTLATTGSVTSMLTGATLDMIATISPPNASDKSIAWSVTSLPAGIATINENGQISTIAGTNGGTITVTATPSNRAATKSATIRVSPPLTGFSTTIADFSAVLGVNNIRNISLNPSGAADRTFSWVVTDLEGTNVANVTNSSMSGITVVGNNIGSARVTLTATADPTITTSFVITVSGTPVTKLNAITFTPSSVKATAVDNGASVMLTSSTNPDASNKNILWTCEDPSITVVPSASNSTTNTTSSCTVTCVNSSYKATKTVTIVGTSQSNPSVTIKQNLTIKIAAKPKITIATTPTVAVKTLFVSNTLSLAASVANSSDSIVWSSNTPLLATVASDGVVTGVKAGNSTIKASLSTDPTIFAVYAIKITNVVPSSISLSSSTVTIATGTSTSATGTVSLTASSPSLTATVNPSNVTVPGVKWSVSPAGFATINTSGNLTLLKTTTTGKPISVVATTNGAPAKKFTLRLTIVA